MIHNRTWYNMAAVNVQITGIALIVVVKCLMLCTEVVTFNRIRSLKLPFTYSDILE